MTRFLIYVTTIFLIIGIPTALAELVQPSRGQWIHWIIIASAVLAALWILDLVLWIRAKREESKFFRNRATNESSPEKYAGAIPTFEDTAPPPELAYWEVNDKGQATPIYKPRVVEHIVSEPISYIVPEPLMSQSAFQREEDLLSKVDKHKRTQAETELIKEIKEDIRDERLRRKWGRL